MAMGKIIGGLIGFAIGGPAGAAVGAGIGHFIADIEKNSYSPSGYRETITNSSSENVNTFPPKKPYNSYCWNCKSPINETMSKCADCGWYICKECGKCGCGFKGVSNNSGNFVANGTENIMLSDEQENAEIQLNNAYNCLESGDFKTALDWFLKAAKQGQKDAVFALQMQIEKHGLDSILGYFPDEQDKISQLKNLEREDFRDKIVNLSVSEYMIDLEDHVRKVLNNITIHSGLRSCVQESKNML